MGHNSVHYCRWSLGYITALEQTSPHNAKAAIYGVTMAIVSVLLTFADLAFKNSILTLNSSCLHYNFLSKSKEQLIQFSMIPLAFSVCVFCSRVLRQPSHKHKLIFVLNCKHLGFINLDIESGGILFDNDKPTQFGCPAYHIEQIHP
uniref:Uncharacterized protein n=1 Tax=Manihot esculenta TaxID=3983 RepID=A0A2C9U3W4_MANES